MTDTPSFELAGALSAFREGDMPRAIERAQTALHVSPGDVDALRIRAAAALRLGREADALRFADEGLVSHPDDVTLLNVAGNALRALGDLQQSATALRHALRLVPDSRDTQLNLALTFAALGYAGEAESLLDSVILLGGDSARTRTLLGRLAFEDGRLEAAEQHLRRAIGLPAVQAEARVLLAEVLMLRGRTLDAREQAEQACALDATSEPARTMAASLAFELGDTRAALAHLELAHRLAGGVPLRGCTGREWRPDGQQHAGVGFRRAAQLQWLNFAPPRVVPESAAADHAFPQPFSRELFVAELRDALVLPQELLPLGADGTLFVEGFVRDPLTRIRTSRHVRHFADDGRLLLSVPATDPAKRVIGQACLLGAAEDHFSWVYECLARLWIVDQFDDLKDLPVVTGAGPSGLTSWQRQLLRMLGVGGERVIEPATGVSTGFGVLHALSNPVAGLFVSPMATEFLRRRLRPVNAHPRDRLYLSREGLKGRQLDNEAEIWPVLERHGFERIVASRMTLPDLIARLASAAVLLGAEGAPMAHLFVLPRGATVGVLAARGAPTARYYCAAAPLGLDFCYLTTEPVYESHPSLVECDLHLDPAILERFLASVSPVA